MKTKGQYQNDLSRRPQPCPQAVARRELRMLGLELVQAIDAPNANLAALAAKAVEAGQAALAAVGGGEGQR